MMKNFSGDFIGFDLAGGPLCHATFKQLNISYRFYDGDDDIKITKVTENGKTYFKMPDGRNLFTQQHMDTEIGSARVSGRASAEQETKAFKAQLEEMRQAAEEKGQNVDLLSAKIKELEEANMTTEEKAARQVADLQKQLEIEQKTLRSEADKAMNLFREERISTEISNACVAHKAVSVRQIAPLLRAHTELVPKTDPKKKDVILGYEAVVRFPDRDEDGKEIIRDLTVDAAVKRMREMDDTYGNLFVSEQTAGSGTGTLYGGKGDGGANGPLGADMDQEAYNKWAATNIDAG